MSYRQIFEKKLPQAYKKMCTADPDKKKLNVSFVFHLLEAEAETWSIAVNNGTVTIQEGPIDDADSEVTFKKGVFDSFLANTLNIAVAVTFRKIRIKGSTSKLLQFKNILDHLTL